MVPREAHNQKSYQSNHPKTAVLPLNENGSKFYKKPPTEDENVNFLKTEAEKLELAKARADKAESEVAKQVAKTRGWWLT